MSVIIKKIRGREYAYSAYRAAGRIVHKYLGPATSPSVISRIEKLRRDRKVPERFHHLFWDTSPETIDIRTHARYIVERVLEVGGLDAFYWVQRLYPTRLVLETCDVSRKVSQKSKNFWKAWLRYAS